MISDLDLGGVVEGLLVGGEGCNGDLSRGGREGGGDQPARPPSFLSRLLDPTFKKLNCSCFVYLTTILY